MNLSPVGKRDTLKACLQAAQLAAEKERERCEAREATADFAALPPSAQELQKVEWELQDLLADGERGDTLDSHDADVLELRKRIARLTAAQPAMPASKSASKPASKKAASKAQKSPQRGGSIP